MDFLEMTTQLVRQRARRMHGTYKKMSRWCADTTNAEDWNLLDSKSGFALDYLNLDGLMGGRPDVDRPNVPIIRLGSTKPASS